MRYPGFCAIAVSLALFLATAPVGAGSLDNAGAPSAGSGMPTTTQIYDRLDTGAAISPPGAFAEPAAGPGASGRSLAEIQVKLPVADNTNGAAAAEVLSGRTFWGVRTDGNWGLKTGAMANNGAVAITPGTAAKPIAAGYHNGSGTVAGDANLISGNIKAGATIFGVAGSLRYIPQYRIVPKTGQNQCWDSTGTEIGCAGTGQDGEYQYGIDPAVPPTDSPRTVYNMPAVTGTRFIDNGDGTVTDTLTALVWLKNASCFGLKQWAAALNDANTLASGACGLADGSAAGQWRLPNINELHSLGPAWPPASPFTGVQYSWYWSSSTFMGNRVWQINILGNLLGTINKDFVYYFWPVRGGQ